MRRLLWLPLILFVVTAVTFTIARLGPGDPISILQGQLRDPEVRERIRKEKGLDEPLWEQYYLYMKDVLTGLEFGESYRFRGVDVEEIMFPAIWRSMQYNVVALTITMGIGIPVGLFAARRQGTWADPASISTFLLFQSIPSLISVPFLLLFFPLKLGVLEASGWPPDCPIFIDALPTGYECIGVLSEEAIIPIIALSVPGIAVWARYTRAFTLDVLSADYVRTARMKGISETVVMSRHVMRNALLPLSTIIIFSLVGLLEGSFFVETLTGVPGFGRLAFESIGGRDYDMIMAITIVGSTVFVLASIMVDIVYTLIDPRIRYGSRS
jgi:ABC-type dipeptide/oligopeptide/nickel transport system permease component